MSERLYWC